MIVEAIRDYKDLRKNRWINKGERLNVDGQRAKVLVDRKVAKIVEEADKAPPKKSKKEKIKED